MTLDLEQLTRLAKAAIEAEELLPTIDADDEDGWRQTEALINDFYRAFSPAVALELLERVKPPINHEKRVTELMIADAMKIAHAVGRNTGIEEAANLHRLNKADAREIRALKTAAPNPQEKQDEQG